MLMPYLHWNRVFLQHDNNSELHVNIFTPDNTARVYETLFYDVYLVLWIGVYRKMIAIIQMTGLSMKRLN